MEFFSDNATMEDNPKQNTYNITIFSPDGEWKLQLNYKSKSMFGTFGNDDFGLSGSGKNYNYARNPKNDMVFYSFTDMDVSVTNEGTLYRVKANCLANNKTRFKVEATIDVPQPEVTLSENLGYARLEENPFYETWAIYAENDNYKLSYGITGNELLGTFYRADLLMPELYDKKAGKQINVINATAWHSQEYISETDSSSDVNAENGTDSDNQGEVRNVFKIEILGDNHILYEFTMWNGRYEVEIKGEKDIDLPNMVLQDLTEMYGCYQFGAVNDEYGLALSVKPESFATRTSWTRDDLIMQYTRLLTLPDQSIIDIFDIKAEATYTKDTISVKADVTGMDGILYHIYMHSDKGNIMPMAKDTVNIDFGHVSMIDYTRGMGTVGFGAVLPGKYQIRFYVNTPALEGEFETSDFEMDMCDMMVVNEDTYIFHDGKYMNAKMENVDGQIRITADMLCVDEVLYHATMYIDPMKCLEGGDYPISLDDGIDMVAMHMGTEDEYSEYALQFQDLSKVYDQNENVVGDGYYFSFYFGHEGVGIGGEYGYSAGTLANDIHLFYENKCEVRVAPVAGVLTLEPIRQVTINMGMRIRAWMYNISFKVLGQNGAIYTGEGENILICFNEEQRVIEIDESGSDIIAQALENRGLQVRKVMKDGKIIIETKHGEFDMNGMRK